MIIPLLKENILKAFIEAKDESFALSNLFEAHIPDYDKIANLNHYPQISRKTADYIVEQFHIVGKMKGWSAARINMLWLNYGFGCIKPEMKDFELFVDSDKIVMVKEK